MALLIVLTIITTFISFYVDYRYRWISKKRLDYLDKNGVEAYRNLPPPEQMAYEFFVWDFDKLLRK